MTLCDQMGAQSSLALARHELATQLPAGSERKHLEALALSLAQQTGVKLPSAG